MIANSTSAKIYIAIVFLIISQSAISQCSYTFTTVLTNVSCYNGTNGAITVNVTGSGGPFQYQLSQGSSGGWQGSNSFTALAAGTYPVSVKNAVGCISTIYVTLTQPTALSISYSETDPSCAGSSNGSLTTTVSGGTAPYTYAWTKDNVAFSTAKNLTGLSPANYQLIVSDANGCSASPVITSQVRSIGVVGYNQDVVADGSNVSPGSVTNTSLDNCGGNVYFVTGFSNAGGVTGTAGLPVSGSITSANIPANVYKLASYSANNALVIRSASDASCGGATSATLTFQSPYQSPYGTLYVLGTTGSGTGTVNYTVHYSDMSNSTGSLTFLDWATTSTQSAIGGMNRVATGGSFDNSAKFNLYEEPITIAAGNQTKSITSIDFAYNTSGSGRISIMGVTGYTSTVAGVRVNDGPSSNVTPSVVVSSDAPSSTLCAGQVVNFTATASNAGNAPTYQWKVNSVAAGSNSPMFSSAGLNNGDQVTVSLTSSLSCVVTPSASSTPLAMTVNTNVSPSVSIGASANNICSGTPVTFTATPVYGGSAPSYQWKVNSLNAGTGGPTFTSTGLNNADVVSVVMTSNIGCTSGTPAPVASNTLPVSVTTTITPAVSISASATSIHSGNTVNFTSVSSGGGSPSYQWYKNGNAIALETSSSYSTNVIASGDVFALQMTSNATCASTGIVMSNYIPVLIVLPVNLESFTLNVDHANVILNWKTNYEFNSKDYLVQRQRLPGDEFETIGTVNATNNVNGNAYQYRDRPGESGAYLYRVIEEDEDGNQAILGIRQCAISSAEGWQISDVGISWELNTPQSLNYRLMDMSGRVIATDRISGVGMIRKPVGSAIYLLIINFNGNVYTKKLLR